MSKVVLVAVNAKYVHSSLAVWVIAGGVSRYARLAHDIVIAEATINQPDNVIADQVAAYKPDVVGISTYIWNAGKLPGLLKLLRGMLPGAVFVLGGPEASHNAGYWLARGADYVLRGEGEYSFPELLDALEAQAIQGARLAKVAQEAQGAQTAQAVQTAQMATAQMAQTAQTAQTALILQAGDSIAPAIEHNNTVPLCDPIDPYSDAYYAALGGRIAYIETSRGCPFQCAFCMSAGSGVRFFPLEAVKEQIYKLSKSGAHTIKLVDRTFNCNAGRAFELFEYIIGLDTGCCFHFEVAADLFDERTLELLGSAPPGRIQLEAGLQSFFEPALRAASRQTDTAKAARNIRALLRARNIHIHVDLIAGLPYETLPDFMDSFDHAYLLGAHTLQLGFLKLLHGSELRKQAVQLGIKYSKEPPYEIQSSTWLSTEGIQVLKQAENALQHTYNKCRFLSALDYVLSASKLRPFELFRSLGGAVPNHGEQLDGYATEIYNFCVTLPGVDKNELRDRMAFDWLGMVKGNNTPGFLKNPDSRRSNVVVVAKKQLGRAPGRYETAVLLSGKGIYVDSQSRDPVTGLYKISEIWLAE